MELRQLEYFVAVAEEANFTRAAAKVHVAQPGVSAQVRKLERELGHELLDRSGRTVSLTDAGAAVLPYARAALRAAAGARLVADEITGLMRGQVSIGTITSISADLDIPGLLARFHEAHPAVEISLSVANSDELIDQLQAGRLDMAYIGIGPAIPPTIGTHVVTSEPLVAVVSHADPLAGRATISLRALAEQTLISLPRGTGLRACIDEAYTAIAVQPHIAFEAADPGVLAQLAARGLGAAIVPRTIADPRREDLHTIAITRPALTGQIGFAWPTEGLISPAARALISQARAAAPARPEDPQGAAGRQ